MPCAGTRVQDARIDSALQALATCNRRLMCSAAAAPDPAKSKMDRRLPRGMGWWTDLVYGGPGRFSSPRRRRYGRTRARPGVHPAMHTRPPAAAQPTLQRVPRARLSCCGSPAAVRRVDGRDGSRGAAETRRASATGESPSSPTRSRRGGCAARRPRPHRAPGNDLCRRRLQASAAPRAGERRATRPAVEHWHPDRRPDGCAGTARSAPGVLDNILRASPQPERAAEAWALRRIVRGSLLPARAGAAAPRLRYRSTSTAPRSRLQGPGAAPSRAIRARAAPGHLRCSRP